jgi:hypothetical protein
MKRKKRVSGHKGLGCDRTREGYGIVRLEEINV